LVASAVGLSIVPPFSRVAVEPLLSDAYDQAAAELPSEVDPADYVPILPDRDVVGGADYDAKDTGRTALVVDEYSNVIGSRRDDRPAETVVDPLE
jgi:hypothetical protein